jgi:(R,R)-butanediol dehydrogenase / meso-butanediol dehydrogenase / diacetyl reductase
MIAALITGKGEVTLQEFPDPIAPDGGVVVEIAYCGICGTDIHAYQSGRAYRPSICGHEWAGTISSVGGNVKSVAEGDRVVVSVAAACGSCRPCTTGDPSHCATAFLSAIGSDPLAPPHGGFASAIAVAHDRVIKAHPSLTDLQLGQVEPSTVTLHAVRRSGLRDGQLVVVQGAGPIGLTTFQWAKALGAGHVVVIEPSPHRAELARSLGADSVVSPGDEARTLIKELSEGLGGADLVYECVGNGPAVQAAADLVRRGGELCLVGVAEGEASIHPGSWIVKELTVSTSIAYQRHDFVEAMDMLADSRVRIDPLHTRTASLQEFDSVLADLASGSSAEIKVLVDPRL